MAQCNDSSRSTCRGNLDCSAPYSGDKGEVLLSVMSPSNLVAAEEGDDGFWRDEAGKILNISASDLERHAYCPLSWVASDWFLPVNLWKICDLRQK